MRDRRRRRLCRQAALAPLLVALAPLLSCTALPPPQEWGRPRADESYERPAPDERRPPAPAPLRELDWQECLRIARRSSPTVAIARERILQAEARLREARALAFPTLDARASAIRFFEVADFRGRTSQNEVSETNTRARAFLGRNSEIYNAGLDLSYRLFDGGDAYYARRSAQSSLAADRFDAQAVRVELDNRVFTAYVTILLAESGVAIAEEALRFAEEQQRQAQARQDAGEGLAVDTLRFATRASEERFALNQAEANRQVGIAVLSELIGAPVAGDATFATPEGEPEMPEAGLVEQALRNRPQLRALRARVEAAGHRLARERSEWWPAVDFFASYGFISLDDLELSQREDELQMGAALSMNLFAGGATEARTRALEHEVAALRSEERELALQIEREIRESTTALEVAQRNVEVNGETVRLAEDVLGQITAQYQAGEAQILDVTEAELQRTRARSALSLSRADLALSQARLLQALGRTLVGEPGG